MDEIFNNLKLENNGRNILNAENGLTFCIQIGTERFGDSSSSVEQGNNTPLDEPTISVVESELETEEEFVSYEIDADQMKNEVSNCRVNMKGKKSDGTNGYHFRKKNRRLWRTSHSQSNNIDKTNSSNKRHHIKKSKYNESSNTEIKPNDLMSVILNNMSRSETRNHSGLKVMINKETSKCVLKSSYKKSNGTESFTVEPWMNDVPKVLRTPNDKLFLFDKGTNGYSSARSKSALPSSDSSDISSISLNTEKEEFCRNQNIVLIKESNGELKANTQGSEIDNSKVIYWVEGNVDIVIDYVSLSEVVKSSYAKSKKLSQDSLGFELSDYLGNISTYESPPVTKSGAAPGLNVYMSWEAVKVRIEQLQEETMTRFVYHYKTPTFRDEPQPFKKIYFELDTKRKDVDVVIPNKGIPFMFLGICVYSCHLGKKRSKHDYIQEDMHRGLKTKKIGCPAIFSAIRIARFPDFDISNLNPRCQNAVLQELKDAWDFDTSRVRYYVEYHVKEPSRSDHQCHEVMDLMNDNRFKESVDPRILEKVRSLTREGFYKVKVIREKVDEFIRRELFNGGDIPPPSRRRYNPSERDIRYAVFKAREELKKEGKNIVQLECCALATQISESVMNITQEEYLNQVKCCLSHLYKVIKSQEPLEPVFMISSSDTNNFNSAASTPHKRGPKRKRPEDLPNHVPMVVASKDHLMEADHIQDQFADQAMDHFYVGVTDASENAFCPQIYAQDFVGINAGLVDGLQPAPDDGAGVYCISDGTFELIDIP